MAKRLEFDTIDLYLVRVLATVISERSVSRAAMRLATTQPAVSAQLKKLRELTGDPLLVRAGQQMIPTARALQLVGPANQLLREAERLFSPRLRAEAFDPAASDTAFRIAASDYLDPLFLPALVAQVKRLAPGVRLELMPLTQDYDYRRHLGAGDVDIVIGNWLEPPAELHLARLMSDEVVCLVAADHPAARGARGWTVAQYLAAEHVAPMPTHPGAVGVVDQQLAAQGLARNIVVRASHFSLIPRMVAETRLVLTTGRVFCTRFTEALPVRIVRCPVALPPMTYYQLWHDVTHAAAPLRWLREQAREVARELVQRGAAGTRRVA